MYVCMYACMYVCMCELDWKSLETRMKTIRVLTFLYIITYVYIRLTNSVSQSG